MLVGCSVANPSVSRLLPIFDVQESQIPELCDCGSLLPALFIKSKEILQPVWLQNTKPSNASSPWELSGQALSNVCSSTGILGLCSEGAISLFLQHKFFVSSHHHQTVQQQRHKGTQYLLLYFMPCIILGLWCPVFNRGCSQGLLRADWLPVAADSASMEFVQPGCRAQPCTSLSVMLAAAP